jgi:hypothetical protein
MNKRILYATTNPAISGVYFSEMSPEARIKAQRQRASGIIHFMEKHWNEV